MHSTYYAKISIIRHVIRLQSQLELSHQLVMKKFMTAAANKTCQLRIDTVHAIILLTEFTCYTQDFYKSGSL